ncbi:MAG: tRNA dihydrouridine synthase DusB [Firmicutes bacterium]|nr:tRNA dihydrouridine synthase DusB [Bacillota bacterium]
MKIGNVQLTSNIFLAPMAGVTDIGFRTIAAISGAGLTYTEMVSAAALFYKNEKTEQLLEKIGTNKDCVLYGKKKIEAVQLFGKTPEHFKVALQHPLVQQFDIIDINMGCPAKKIVGNGEGCALMKNMQLAEQIIRICVASTNKPVTVKFRAGWDDKTKNCVEFAKMAERAGVSAITIHGRTRAQGYSGLADRAVIKSVVDAVNIPVIANGDVKNAQDVESMIKETGASAVMIGRASLGKPWIFEDITKTKSGFSKEQFIAMHQRLLASNMGAKGAELEMRKHTLWYKKYN